LILALGELGNKKALNILKEVLLDSKADGDTKYTAVESIGKITRNNFIKHKNPTEIALEWLRKNEKQS
jgi:HEAT repeat protein